MNESRYFLNYILGFLIIANALREITASLNGTNVESYKEKPELVLSTNERNRRLIPYATYYIGGEGLVETNSFGQDEIDTRPSTSQKGHLQQKQNIAYQHIPSVYNGYGEAPYIFPNQNSDHNFHFFQKPSTTQSSTIIQNQFTNIRPEYLQFRYSNLYKYPHLTPAVPQITSKPHYFVPAAPYFTTVGPSSFVDTYQSTQNKEPYIVSTVPTVIPKAKIPSYSVNIGQPEVNHYTPEVKYIKMSERTKPFTTMTITKSQEIELKQKDTVVQQPKRPIKLYEQPKHSDKTVRPVKIKLGSQAQPPVTKDNLQIYYHPPKQLLQWQDNPINSQDYTFADFINGGYELNKQLPDRITPGNIKQSIQTLSYILQLLQKADSISQHGRPFQEYTKNIFENLKGTPLETALKNTNEEFSTVNNFEDDANYKLENTRYSTMKQLLKDNEGTPGQPGVDYPIYSIIPPTVFSCKTQRYKGFFADTDTRCQVWHYCDLNGGQASFLCPNGTIFNQAALTCDWWFNVKCAATPQLYVLNERLYKYILPVRPSFPEDFSGPLVDLYLDENFKKQEKEKKNRFPGNATTLLEAHLAGINDTSLDY